LILLIWRLRIDAQKLELLIMSLKNKMLYSLTLMRKSREIKIRSEVKRPELKRSNTLLKELMKQMKILVKNSQR